MEAEFDNDRLVADELDQVGEYGMVRSTYRGLGVGGVMKPFSSMVQVMAGSPYIFPQKAG